MKIHTVRAEGEVLQIWWEDGGMRYVKLSHCPTEERIGYYLPPIHHGYQEAFGFHLPEWKQGWPDATDTASLESTANHVLDALFYGGESLHGTALTLQHYWDGEHFPPPV